MTNIMDTQEVKGKVEEIESRLRSDILAVQQQLDKDLENLRVDAYERITALKLKAEQDMKNEIDQARDTAVMQSKEIIQDISNISATN